MAYTRFAAAQAQYVHPHRGLLGAERGAPMNEIECLERLSEKEIISELLDIPEKEIKCTSIIDILNSPMEVCKEMSPMRRERILAAGEFARRLLAGPYHSKLKIRSRKELAMFAMTGLSDETQEVLIAIAFDAQWNLLAIKEIARTGYEAVSIRNMDIFREMLKYPVQDLALIHKCPHCDPEPTEDDINYTNNAIYCGAALGIRVIDSIIIGDDTFVSLRDRGCCVFKQVEDEVKNGTFQG